MQVLAVAAALALVLSGDAALAAAPVRAALLIGDSDYDLNGHVDASAEPTDGHARDLRNPANDVTDVGAVLRQAGYDTRVLTNATLAETREAVDWLAARNRAAGPEGVIVFYFAGHGVNVNATDYLVPAGARIPSLPDAPASPGAGVDAALHAAMGLPDPGRAAALSDEFFPVSALRSALPDRIAGQGPLRVFIFDNCRDNPFDVELAGLRRFFAQHSSQMLMGPAIGMDTPLFVFSATPPQLARDGAGRNSPFAAALLRHIARPSQTVVQMAVQVQHDVATATRQAQTPDAIGLTDFAHACLVSCPP